MSVSGVDTAGWRPLLTANANVVVRRPVESDEDFVIMLNQLAAGGVSLVKA